MNTPPVSSTVYLYANHGPARKVGNCALRMYQITKTTRRSLRRALEHRVKNWNVISIARFGNFDGIPKW